VGRLEETASFGEGRTLTTRGLKDIFVARYDAAGGIVWLRQAGGSAKDLPTDCAVLEETPGRVCVVGTIAGEATFGDGENRVTLKPNAPIGTYIAIYDLDGNLCRAECFGGPTRFGYPCWIRVLSDGSIFFTGPFASTITFGNRTLTAVDGDDIFLVRFTPDLQLVWAKQAGGEGGDWPRGLALSPDGTSWVTGYFDSTVTFVVGESSPTQLTTARREDTFLARFSP
jgi:hypothetical protein